MATPINEKKLVCFGFCPAHEVLQAIATDLISLVKRRESTVRLLNGMDSDSFPAADSAVFNVAGVGSIEQIELSRCIGLCSQLAAISRSWIENSGTNPPEDLVVGRIWRSGDPSVPAGGELIFVKACNYILHSKGMWFQDPETSECGNSAICFAVPRRERRGGRLVDTPQPPFRIYEMCLLKFALAILDFVALCPTCAGSITDLDVDGEGVPQAFTDPDSFAAASARVAGLPIG